MIDKILATAIKLWLRSQLDLLEELQVEITGSDRQILTGYLPGVFFTSSHGVYQGLHLRQIQLSGKNIKVNLAQILKGKPLQLLEPVTVTGEISLNTDDLQLSLSSPLLSGALTDLLVEALKIQGVENPRQTLATYKLNWDKIHLVEGKLTIVGTLNNPEGETARLSICTALHLANHHTLMLSPLRIDDVTQLPFSDCQELCLDLGTEVEIAKLNMAGETLFCSVGLTVFP
jgi:hypothetical protein